MSDEDIKSLSVEAKEKELSNRKLELEIYDLEKSWYKKPKD